MPPCFCLSFCPSNLVRRNGSRVDDSVGEPGGLSGWEDHTRVITRERNLGQHQASISEEETLAWADGEDSSDSEDSEEGLEWNFEAFRRRSSVVSARLLRGRLARNSGVATAVAPLNPVVMAAQIKFQAPPTFTGQDGEDVVSWIHRYEKVSRYNRWGEDELRDHIELSLEGAAGKWYACMEATGNLPNAWSDVQGPPVVRGVKSTLLTQFTPVNYVQHNEAKLRAKKQGIKESILEYFYDVLDLCRREQYIPRKDSNLKVSSRVCSGQFKEDNIIEGRLLKGKDGKELFYAWNNWIHFSLYFIDCPSYLNKPKSAKRKLPKERQTANKRNRTDRNQVDELREYTDDFSENWEGVPVDDDCHSSLHDPWLSFKPQDCPVPPAWFWIHSNKGPEVPICVKFQLIPWKAVESNTVLNPEYTSETLVQQMTRISKDFDEAHTCKGVREEKLFNIKFCAGAVLKNDTWRSIHCKPVFFCYYQQLFTI
ncbi:Uncharacterized protein APZ42_025936 [Daphnia magna]|uniref:Retrotransposon gag domain-containing protein n=1 Tax=Daphnia magna TaxID=35525 RepID=A0A164SMI8_9CRUS|nr:Uncharacterized protein APZ42_025936 [Daphnia magna]